MNERYCSIIQIIILSISMQIQNLIDIHKLIHKIFSINKILTSIMGHNHAKNWQKITCIIYNMGLVYISAYTKFYQNASMCFEDIDWGNHIFPSIKANNSVVKNDFSPFAILNHSFLISMFMQSLKKIGQKCWSWVRKRSADGRTDGHSNGSEGIT